MIRPLVLEDVEEAQRVMARAFADLNTRKGEPVREQTERLIARGRRRVAHLVGTDPDSSWAATVDGTLVGVALALVRDGMWFLSLLVVDPAYQGKGVGAELLDAALRTSTDRSWILSTVDPAALRRYRRAGFDLHPSYTAKGRPDLSKAVGTARPGDWDADAGLVDEVLLTLRRARGAGDLVVPRAGGFGLFVVDDDQGKGFVVTIPGGVIWLGATTPQAAVALLWTALREAGEQVEVDWLTAEQQWAVDVCLDARLSLTAGASLCLRGQPQPWPYLPSGAFG